jgi:hypothetical protein
MKETCDSMGGSARNRNVEVPAYFLKAKQGYSVRKMKTVYNDK